MNYLLWLSGFLAGLGVGLGVGIGIAAMITRRLPLTVNVRSESDVYLKFEEPGDDSEKWKETT